MKIAFDGTVLHGRKSGVGYYCEELLKAMLAIEHSAEFFIFSHQRLRRTFEAPSGNLRLAGGPHFPVRAIYLHALLPGILNRIGPDLCHYTNFLAPISEGRPYVVTIHDMSLEALPGAHPLAKRLYTRRLVPLVARKARLIITNSEYSKFEIVRRLGVAEDRIRVTPLAAAPEFKPTPSGRPGDPYFLYVGNLEPRKNLERLIEAFAQLPQKDHRLIIAGNRWYQGDAPERKAQELGVHKRVEFLGYTPRSELPALYSGATAFVYPSLLEGFGLPVVEAMACGTPVVTSNNSALKELAEGAAILIDPRSIRQITEALACLAEDERRRQELSRRGLARASEFTWQRTAQLTLETYREAIEGRPHRAARRAQPDLVHAIRKTIGYARLFQYPLTPAEVRERLIDVEADEETLAAALRSIRYKRDPALVALRKEREEISDRAIAQAQAPLRTLASIPFVRMVAFSGSTAHRNMTAAGDIDLFLVAEDGKIWSSFLLALLWAKARGLRNNLCMNYWISDAALPLVERDLFTAQQAASLKPVFGKKVYDRFIAANPFIRRRFPNFDQRLHRRAYAELEPARWKKPLESLLRAGPVQALEALTRFALGRYLRRKIREESDVKLDGRRLKLHFHSHKEAVLRAGGGFGGNAQETERETCVAESHEAQPIRS